MTMMVFSPNTFNANFKAMAAPQPGHPRWPGLK
jgi:hypothetical protein